MTSPLLPSIQAYSSQLFHVQSKEEGKRKLFTEKLLCLTSVKSRFLCTTHGGSHFEHSYLISLKTPSTLSQDFKDRYRLKAWDCWTHLHVPRKSCYLIHCLLVSSWEPKLPINVYFWHVKCKKATDIRSSYHSVGSICNKVHIY
jgi:hypothetical protein